LHFLKSMSFDKTDSNEISYQHCQVPRYEFKSGGTTLYTNSADFEPTLGASL